MSKNIQTINVTEFLNKVKSDSNIQLVDVRMPSEFNGGHLQGAKLITVTDADFAQRVQSELDPAKPVAVYCQGGHRSLTAAQLLQRMGFDTIYDMAGGYMAYLMAGHK